MGVTFPVSEHLRDELEARGWSIETFCEQTGLQRHRAEEILAGHQRLTKLTAMCIANGLGVSPGTLLALQESHKKGGE